MATAEGEKEEGMEVVRVKGWQEGLYRAEEEVAERGEDGTRGGGLEARGLDGTARWRNAARDGEHGSGSAHGHGERRRGDGERRDDATLACDATRSPDARGGRCEVGARDGTSGARRMGLRRRRRSGSKPLGAWMGGRG